jgi:hypothetical protein
MSGRSFPASPCNIRRVLPHASRTFYEASEISNFARFILQRPIDDHLLSLQTAVPLISQSRDRQLRGVILFFAPHRLHERFRCRGSTRRAKGS